MAIQHTLPKRWNVWQRWKPRQSMRRSKLRSVKRQRRQGPRYRVPTSRKPTWRGTIRPPTAGFFGRSRRDRVRWERKPWPITMNMRGWQLCWIVDCCTSWRRESWREHFKHQVKTGKRLDAWRVHHSNLDAWGVHHSNLTPDQRWARVDELFTLDQNGAQVPLGPEFFKQNWRYLVYRMTSEYMVHIVKRCIEAGITEEEILAYQHGVSGVSKISHLQSEAADADIDANDELDARRSQFVRRILRYTYPEKLAYKYCALKEEENAEDILSIPIYLLVACFDRNGGKSTIWEHVAMYLSGFDIDMTETIKRIGEFFRPGGNYGKLKIPWYFRQIARLAPIQAIGDEAAARGPSGSAGAQETSGTGKKKSRTNKRPGAPPRLAASTEQEKKDQQDEPEPNRETPRAASTTGSKGKDPEPKGGGKGQGTKGKDDPDDQWNQGSRWRRSRRGYEYDQWHGRSHGNDRRYRDWGCRWPSMELYMRRRVWSWKVSSNSILYIAWSSLRANGDKDAVHSFRPIHGIRMPVPQVRRELNSMFFERQNAHSQCCHRRHISAKGGSLVKSRASLAIRASLHFKERIRWSHRLIRGECEETSSQSCAGIWLKPPCAVRC